MEEQQRPPKTLYPKLSSTVSRAYLYIFRRHWSRRHHLSSSASSCAAFLCVAFIATLLDSIEPVSGKEEIFKEKGKLNKLLLPIYRQNSALRARSHKSKGIVGLLVTYPVSPNPWTRPYRYQVLDPAIRLLKKDMQQKQCNNCKWS